MADLHELCRRAKVSDYLESRGIELVTSGQKKKCKCPLPDHQGERTPSFYIGEFPDGGEYFKCFGCDASGNVVTLIRLMEGKKKHQIVEDLSRSLGLSLSGYDPAARIEPMAEDVLALFCEEETAAMTVATYARKFLRMNGGSADAVNKVSRLYQKLDKMIETGDEAGISEIREAMGDLLVDFGQRKKKS